MKKIFISRNLKSDSIFLNRLESEGFEVRGESLLEFEFIPFKKIPDVDWIFFYSQKGVTFFFNHIRQNNIPLRGNIRFAGFGNMTSEKIKSFGVECHFIGQGNAKQTADLFLAQAKNQKVLFPRAKNSQRSVQQLIENQSLTVDFVIYKNKTKADFDIPKMDYLVFTSPLNAKAFFKKYKKQKGQKIFAIGNTTATTLADIGIKEVIFPQIPSEKNLVRVLLGNV